MTTVACPHCREPLEVPPDLRGTEVRCAACQVVFRVPDSTPLVPVPAYRPPRLSHPPEPPRKSNRGVWLLLLVVAAAAGVITAGCAGFMAWMYNPKLHEVRDPGGRFRLDMPGEAHEVNGLPDGGKAGSRGFDSTLPANGHRYSIRYLDLDDAPADSQKALDDAVARENAASPPGPQKSRVMTTHDGYPALDVWYEREQGLFHETTILRAVLIGRRVYVLAARGNNVEPHIWWVMRFFRSFEVAEGPAKPAVIFEGKLEKLAEKGVAGEGPAWDPTLGVLTSGNGHINRYDRDGDSSVFRKDAGTNGLLFDAQGRLVACEPKRKRVTRTGADGTVKVLTDSFNGKKYNDPNDLTIDSKGRIYFSDPRYGDRGGMEQKDAAGNTIEGVYRIDPDGTVKRVIGREVERANGVLVSGDDKTLYVADNNNDTKGGARKLWKFDLTDGDVDLGSKTLVYDWGTGRGPDGLKQDAEGRLYVAAGVNAANKFETAGETEKAGIYVLSSSGEKLSFLAVPTDEVTNCAFGGPDLKTLYVTGGGVLYSVKTGTPGRVVWNGKKK